MNWLSPAFIEGRVLPVVCAFGLGVAVTTHAARVELEHSAQRADALVREVETVRIACGAQPDPAAVASRYVQAEVRTEVRAEVRQ